MGKKSDKNVLFSKTKRRRKKERRLEVDSLPAAHRKFETNVERLSANRWFARRFHMVEMFGWRLPLSPTEKKLKHSLSIASGRKPGILAFDHSFISIYMKNDGTPVYRHPAEEPHDLNPLPENDLSAKFVIIGSKKNDFFPISMKTLHIPDSNKEISIRVETDGDYIILFTKPSDSTALLSFINTAAGGHIGGLGTYFYTLFICFVTGQILNFKSY